MQVFEAGCKFHHKVTCPLGGPSSSNRTKMLVSQSHPGPDRDAMKVMVSSVFDLVKHEIAKDRVPCKYMAPLWMANEITAV